MDWPWGFPERCNAHGNALIRLWNAQRERDAIREPEVKKKKENVQKNALLVIAELKKKSAGRPMQTHKRCAGYDYPCPYGQTVEDRASMFDDSGGKAVLCTLTPNPVYLIESTYEVDRSEFRSVGRLSQRPQEIEAPDWCPLALANK